RMAGEDAQAVLGPPAHRFVTRAARDEQDLPAGGTQHLPAGGEPTLTERAPRRKHRRAAQRRAVEVEDRCRGQAQPTSGSDLTIPPRSRRSASISSAIETIARADAASGCAVTTGAPASPCSRSAGSSGTVPSSGTPRSP